MLLIDIDAEKQVCTIGEFKYKGENMSITVASIGASTTNVKNIYIYNYEMKLLQSKFLISNLVYVECLMRFVPGGADQAASGVRCVLTWSKQRYLLSF